MDKKSDRALIKKLVGALEKIERNAARALHEGTHSSEQHNTLKFIRDNARDFLAEARLAAKGDGG
jgi:hypothetical protein